MPHANAFGTSPGDWSLRSSNVDCPGMCCATLHTRCVPTHLLVFRKGIDGVCAAESLVVDSLYSSTLNTHSPSSLYLVEFGGGRIASSGNSRESHAD
uniref:Uncharacterized protein n=1 Tax=Mycena chlorophos TaxID=658473 RepID=A0ABQ0MAX3_MYCCL|nr:predicted protein [Mycena chlorophos]